MRRDQEHPSVESWHLRAMAHVGPLGVGQGVEPDWCDTQEEAGQGGGGWSPASPDYSPLSPASTWLSPPPLLSAFATRVATPSRRSPSSESCATTIVVSRSTSPATVVSAPSSLGHTPVQSPPSSPPLRSAPVSPIPVRALVLSDSDDEGAIKEEQGADVSSGAARSGNGGGSAIAVIPVSLRVVPYPPHITQFYGIDVAFLPWIEWGRGHSQLRDGREVTNYWLKTRRLHLNGRWEEGRMESLGLIARSSP